MQLLEITHRTPEQIADSRAHENDRLLYVATVRQKAQAKRNERETEKVARKSSRWRRRR